MQPAHDGAAHAMAHHDDARVQGGDLGKHLGRAGAQLRMRFSAGRAVAVRIGAPVRERRGMRDFDLLPGEAFPLSVGELGEADILTPVAARDPDLAADDLRRFAGATERAPEKDRRLGLPREFASQGASHGQCLLSTAFGEIGVLGALHAAFGVPRGFAVAQHVERGGELHGVRFRITILAAP